MLDESVARRLAALKREIVDKTAERDALIVAAYWGGASHREVARAVGLAPTTVMRTCERSPVMPADEALKLQKRIVAGWECKVYTV